MNPTVPLKIRRLCWVVRGVAILLLGSVLVLYLGSWLFPDWGMWEHHWARMARIGGLPAKALGASHGMDRFLIGAASLPYLACLSWAFYHLHRMLHQFEAGEFFERSTVRHLRAFSGLLLLAKVLSLTAMHLRVFMYAPLAPAGTKFAFNITGDDLAVLLLCALIFLIAHLMEEGGRLAEENRGFV